MAVTDGLLLLAAFVLGAWVRKPFTPARLPGKKSEDAAVGIEERLEEKRQRQREAVLSYSLEDARRAAASGK